MLITILKVVQILIIFSIVAAMIVYQIWFKKPAPPVYYRGKRKRVRFRTMSS